MLRFMFGTFLLCSTVFALKTVKIAKCCHLNEYLTNDSKCAKNDSSSWDLRIFNGRNKSLDHYQVLPNHWKILEALNVSCTNPSRVPLLSKSYFPFLNGSLFSVEHDKFFHPHQYCLDYYYALICLEIPENLTQVKVKKCCGPNAIFSQNDSACKMFKDYNGTYNLHLDPNFTQIAGFPECGSNKLQVHEIKKSELLANGSLLIDNKFHIEAGNFCLEFVLGHTGMYSHYHILNFIH